MTGFLHNRWAQLFVGIVCMVMISSLQHGWTLFVHPINEKHAWGRAAIQVAFTVFILSETWLVPFEGWVVDRFGPRPVALSGGALVAIAWSLNSVADSLPLLYLGAALGGIGAGCVYGTCLGNALKWFPDRRGLAAGLTVAGYGIGSAFTIIPMHHTIEHHGYEAAFLWFGLGQGAMICLASLALRKPEAEVLAIPERLPHAVHDHTPGEVLRSPLFWILFAMSLLVTAAGLTFTANLAGIARSFGVADVPVTLIGFTLPALTFALTLDRLANGIARPLCGWLSDYIGRENTMFFAFTLGALSILAFARWGNEPAMFVLLVCLVFFAWGEVASLFPATCTDYFGSGYATTNAGMLHTAKGFAAMLVPLADPVVRATGDWQLVFAIAVGANAVAAFLGIAVLRPMRAAWLRRE
ncbi:oxalate/formate MFS antiporter [uncultured Reyranella sp.]|uniref:oxalate/formate MFS antiporter n=1 Tax=uncultured Reyranella sp. TaxID=735512 RepID=UPI00259C6B9B|nr:oxalate/formate MFS antiporter [uncultured Reyranella sp.]